MKGLIKYELKRIISLWWLVYAAVMIFLFVVRTREETYNYFAYVLASIHIVKIAADTVRADEESGWLALQGILPVSKRQYLTVKYIRYGIVTALNCCFIYTLIGIRCALNGSFGILPFWVPVPCPYFCTAFLPAERTNPAHRFFARLPAAASVFSV